MTNPFFFQCAFVTSPSESKIAVHAHKNDTQVYYYKTLFYLSDMRFMMYSMSESPNFGAVSNKIPFSSEASG